MIIRRTTENTLISKYQADLACCCLPDMICVIFCPPEIFLTFFFGNAASIVRESKAFCLKSNKLFFCYFIRYLNLLVKARELAALGENSVSNEKSITVVNGY